MKREIVVANYLRMLARYGLAFLSFTAFVFSLISGAEEYGEGLLGIIKNSPNSLPWAVLLLLGLIGWKRELFGGVAVTILGLVSFVFFNLIGTQFFLSTFILTCGITLLGVFYLGSWFLRRPYS